MNADNTKQCQELSNHQELGDSGRCWCGAKTYPKAKPRTTVPRCGFCGKDPQPSEGPLNPGTGLPNEVFCATEGCPAFSNVVTLEKWLDRGAHEKLIMDIPLEEPIFVLRAQDGLALTAIYTWVDLGEKRKVNEEKLNRAVAHAEEFQSYQRANGCKIPD